MSAQSRPVAAKGSAIIKRGQLDRSRSKVERISAIVVLIVSFIGSVVAFHGGWGPILSLHLSVAAIIGGILAQILLSWAEWAYYHRRVISYGARIVDASLTAVGYGPLVIKSLAAVLAERGASAEPAVFGMSVAVLGAWVIVGLVSYGIAWYPESRLID